MSSKDVKSLLKEAREAIKKRDYTTSLKLSKIILKNDKDNYMGLVFLGVSIQETNPNEFAANAFKKAIGIDSKNALAWNGLANYYEKQQGNDAKKELVNIYISILELESNEKKIQEICDKLQGLPISENNFTKVLQALANVGRNKEYSQHTLTQTWISVVGIILKYPEWLPLWDVYEEGLSTILSISSLVTKHYYSEYLKVLYKQQKYDILIESAEKMYDLFSTELISLEWICKVFNEAVIEETSLFLNKQEVIEKYCDILLKHQPKSGIGLFTKAVFVFEKKKYVEANDLLKQVIDVRSGLLHAWYLLAVCNMKLHIYNEASHAIIKADKMLQSINNSNTILRTKINNLLPEAISRSREDEFIKEGIDFCLKLLDEKIDSFKVYNCLTRCYINARNFSKAKAYLSKLKKFEDQDELMISLLNAQLLHKEGHIDEALQLLQSNDNVNLAEWWYEIAMLYWDQESYQLSLVPLLKAAKIEPNCYMYFLYLGHYYRKFEDMDKSRRCYEKTFTLNPKCIDAAAELSKIYRLLKKWDANVILLQNITGGIVDTENCWAWLQLGLNYLDQEDYSRAIETLRFVVRSNPSNSYCWESLGDAYMHRGAYTSALRCYQKAVEINPKLLYSLFQLATIKQLLGQYTDARTDYETVLKTNKLYVPALKGLAETCILKARQHLKNQLLGLARDFAQNALDAAIKGIQQRNDLACLWKLAGDGCYIVATLPDRYCCMLVLAAFANGGSEKENVVLEREQLYSLAIRCYYKSLSFIEDKALIWHDLAACSFSFSQNTSNVEQTKTLIDQALIMAKHCVSINPTIWKHWNLMGIIAFNNEPRDCALAQHAFIKAIKIDNNIPEVWCNLGALYLILNDLRLANETFSQAQRADPNYVNSWVGQAMVAELCEYDEAMDLFRHSTQLGSHQQGGIGYGYWVCRTLMEAPPHSTLYSIHNMHAIPVACDVLTWCTENDPDDACAWNMLGLIRERLGLKTTAADAFRNALRLSNKNNRDKVRINYGRLLFQLGKYKQAINMFQEVDEVTFNTGSGLALSLFKDNRYQESYESYNQALHWLTDEQASQSDLLVALASMVYMSQGPDPTKMLLFQSIQRKPASPFALYATLSLGLLHEDFNMAELALKELHNLKDDPKCIGHYSLLLCATYYLQGEHKKAIRELSKLVHRHPNEASVWLSMSVLLLRLSKHQPSRIMAAGRCAQLAVILGRANMDITKVLCVVSLAAFLNKDYKEAVVAAQKAIRCYPNVAESWTALIGALLMYKPKLEILQKNNWIKDASEYVKQHLNPSESIQHWFKGKML